MNYILFCLIIISIISIPFFKKHHFGIITLLLIMVFLLVRNPELSISSAETSIMLFLFTVLPALFPFFLINDMLVTLRVPENISKLFSPITKLMFNTSGYGAYAFIMSIFSGYPTGVKITANLVEHKTISPQEGQKILTFSSTSGPLFIIGVVGTSLLSSPYIGYMLFLIHIISALLNGLLFNFLISPKQISHKANATIINKPISTSAMITDSILNSLETCGIIGGYVILFGVIIPLMDSIKFFSTFTIVLNKFLLIPLDLSKNLTALIKASIELTNGTAIISKLPTNMDSKLVLLSFIIAFSGFSIIGQATSLINRTSLSSKTYVLTKVSHGFIASILCYILIHFNVINVPQAVINTSTVSFVNISTLELLEITLTLILFLNLFYKKLSKLKFTRFYRKIEKRTK